MLQQRNQHEFSFHLNFIHIKSKVTPSTKYCQQIFYKYHTYPISCQTKPILDYSHFLICRQCQQMHFYKHCDKVENSVTNNIHRELSIIVLLFLSKIHFQLGLGVCVFFWPTTDPKRMLSTALYSS